jgi:catechol 2,3-dioxygenase-like lactoylglutathione lyase family enzyme
MSRSSENHRRVQSRFRRSSSTSSRKTPSMSVAAKLQDGTEVHVYGPKDKDHGFFGEGPVVAFQVDNFAVAQARLLAAAVEFIYPEPQRAAGKIWQHFRAPDGNVYELIGDDAAT